MSSRKGFTFEPRSLIATPKQFGSIRHYVEPADGISEEDPRFQAARMQHLLANEVREHLGKYRRDVAWFASPKAGHPGIGVDRMRRMLRGETMMQIADMMIITSMVKSSVEVVQDCLEVDLLEVEELKSDNKILHWVLENCNCPARRKIPAQR